MKKYLIGGFIVVLLIIITSTAIIRMVNQIPKMVTAAYKQKVWDEVTAFVIAYPTENFTFFELAFTTQKKYESKLKQAIIDEFGREDYEVFTSMYDSVKQTDPSRVKSVFYGMEKESVARDSIWQRFKNRIRDEVMQNKRSDQ